MPQRQPRGLTIGTSEYVFVCMCLFMCMRVRVQDENGDMYQRAYHRVVVPLENKGQGTNW